MRDNEDVAGYIARLRRDLEQSQREHAEDHAALVQSPGTGKGHVVLVYLVEHGGSGDFHDEAHWRHGHDYAWEREMPESTPQVRIARAVEREPSQVLSEQPEKEDGDEESRRTAAEYTDTHNEPIESTSPVEGGDDSKWHSNGDRQDEPHDVEPDRYSKPLHDHVGDQLAGAKRPAKIAPEDPGEPAEILLVQGSVETVLGGEHFDLRGTRRSAFEQRRHRTARHKRRQQEHRQGHEQHDRDHDQEPPTNVLEESSSYHLSPYESH